MDELTAFQSFWILAVNTLLHELGLPLPVMPTAFVLGARGMRGAGDFLLLIAAIVAGMLIGNSVWFAAGRRYGAGVLKSLCRFSLTADTCVSRTESVRTMGLVVARRFVPGALTDCSATRRCAGMTWVKFLALTTAGAKPWPGRARHGDAIAGSDQLGATGVA
jgi:membrane protein DedA with SNARE-associated domain